MNSSWVSFLSSLKSAHVRSSVSSISWLCKARISTLACSIYHLEVKASRRFWLVCWVGSRLQKCTLYVLASASTICAFRILCIRLLRSEA